MQKQTTEFGKYFQLCDSLLVPGNIKIANSAVTDKAQGSLDAKHLCDVFPTSFTCIEMGPETIFSQHSLSGNTSITLFPNPGLGKEFHKFYGHLTEKQFPNLRKRRKK